ncbi:hypothetical protein [Parabacteroides sp. Marseille-P3160]|nr:hypothetical protein [Parabacteroides sp. Marseille-P3160]
MRKGLLKCLLGSLFLSVFTVCTANAQKINELTQAEVNDGWQLLFDGKK